MAMSRIARRKKLAIDLCQTPYEELGEMLSGFHKKDLINPLFSYICSNDLLLRWRAVSAFGIVVPQIADDTPEAARIIMRRFLWSLNDESGGIGWGAPESMAEIMCNHDLLRKEYLHMLISYMREDGEELCADGNFLELPFLQQGLLWAVTRVSRQYPELMVEKGVVDDLKLYLDSEDCLIVAFATKGLKILQGDVGQEVNDVCKNMDREFTLYENGQLQTVSISEFLN